MRLFIIFAAAMSGTASAAMSQEIVEVPASQAGVSLPEDIFGLPSGQWYVSKQVSQGNAPCNSEACEAGFHSGDFVMSVEHAGKFVQVIAGFRGCPAVAFQELETGFRPGKSKRGELSNLIRKVAKAAEKSCKREAIDVPKLDVASLFPTGVP